MPTALAARILSSACAAGVRARVATAMPPISDGRKFFSFVLLKA